MLNIYNSLTRAKQRFVALQSGKVGMYVCGMTVYDFCHLGHARVLVVFDLVSRWLQTSGYDVIYVRNITDIDDKIIKRALENGEPFQHLTERFIEAMNEDAAALGVRKPEFEPRATANIPQMLQLIGKLIDKGMAYRADNGDVYYVVHKFNGYGKLSGKSLEQLRAGARVDINPNKREPLDFVLWKAAKAGEPSWDSPWGKGRPGWHIECSAMSERYLGTHFDIHGGGQDLQFPHHENEIAQSEGAHGHTFVNYWMHNGFVRVNEEKMSKSLGNFITVRDLLDEWPGEAIRLAMIMTHYRQPFNWTQAGVKEAKRTLDHWYQLTEDAEVGCAVSSDVLDALGDDLNTPKALTAMHALRSKAAGGDKNAAASLKACGQFLGVLNNSNSEWAAWRPEAVEIDDGQIEQLIAARLEARGSKDFAEADRIRDELAEMGVDYLAIGSLVPFFNKNHEMRFVAAVLSAARKTIGNEVPIHIYGAGDPCELPFLYKLGADIFDSSSYAHYAKGGWYMTPYGSISDAGPLDAGEYLCECPICKEAGNIQDVFGDEELLTRHNLWTICATVEALRSLESERALDEMLEHILEVHEAWFPTSALKKTWSESQSVAD